MQVIPSLFALGALVLAAVPRPALADPRTKPVLEQIQGAKTLQAVPGTSAIPSAKPRQIAQGEEIEYGERIKTPDKVSATILYPDDSRLSVLPNSDVEVEPKVEDAQWNRLRKGEVRGVVTKAKEGTDLRRPRFVIRTSAAVMGVRGTDFVMSLAPGAQSAQVHTLEGTVEVAKDEMSLLSGGGTPVNAGSFVSSSVSEGVSKTQAFDKVQFLKEFEAAKAGAVPQAAAAGGASALTSLAPGAGSAASAVSAGGGMGLPSLSPGVPPSAVPPALRPPEVPPLPPTLANAPSGPKDEAKKDETDNSRKMHLLTFQAGGFFAVDLNKNTIRSLTASWNPEIPIPYTEILSVRGHLGGNFALQGSFNNNFLVYEAQGFGVVTLFRALYAEAGLGTQYWKTDGLRGGMASVNIGLNLASGMFRYAFIGRSWLGDRTGEVLIDQYRVGVGFGF